ncbi:MAG: hypothetical protein JRH15_21055, partial [Deltaproteobacteria bacterium]|nr:hypothetical protein [Deltaproteobacteria bacterium]
LAAPPTLADLPGTRKLLRVDEIVVTQAPKAEDAVLSCLQGGCLPAGVDTYDKLIEFIAGYGCERDNNGNVIGYAGTDGWWYEFPETGERNLGQASLLGGLLTYTTYQPFDDLCRPEGLAFLYGLYYQTGTAWHVPVFLGDNGDPPEVESRIEIGRGLATTPNLHVGRQDGATAFVQTSTGAIVEIKQPNLPIKAYKTGRVTWRTD